MRALTTIPLLLVLAAPGWAGDWMTTLTLDEIPVAACDEIWSEPGGVEDLLLFVGETTAEDCDGGGHCDFTVVAGGLHLSPARLVVQATWELIYYVAVDVVSSCEAGCTRVCYYDDDWVLQECRASTEVGIAETIELADIDYADFGGYVVVSGCDTVVDEIRLGLAWDYVDPTAWSEVKARYRD
jgi:hypothetical protein